MIIKLKWFMTGNMTEMDEADDILNPNTTILEVKGLIQVRFGFLPKEIAIIYKHLLDNYVTLREIGITSSASDIVLTAHVIRSQAGLEKKNALDGEEEEGDDDDLQEFTHDDYILAMKMLGKEVPVSGDRIQQVRENAPRSRPAFLNATQQQRMQEEVTPNANPTGYNPRNTEVHKIFQDFRYGMRKENVDKEFAVEYPGIPEPFQYWDMRLPEDDRHQSLCTLNEVCFELFYFGEFTVIKDQDKFLTLIRRVLEVKAGVNARTPLLCREAGCMYPLVAIPVVMTEMEGMMLGNLLLEDFGSALPATRASEQGAGVAGRGSACAPQ